MFLILQGFQHVKSVTLLFDKSSENLFIFLELKFYEIKYLNARNENFNSSQVIGPFY